MSPTFKFLNYLNHLFLLFMVQWSLHHNNALIFFGNYLRIKSIKLSEPHLLFQCYIIGIQINIQVNEILIINIVAQYGKPLHLFLLYYTQ